MRILRFSAIWCPSCLVMRPIWNSIEKEMSNFVIENYDYDINSEEVEKWNIGGVLPVVIFLNENDEEIMRLIGEKTKKELLDTISNLQKK